MQKLFQKIVPIAIMFLTVGDASSNEQGHLAFFSTLQQAVDNNDQIKASRANLLAAKERIKQNRAALFPNLSLEFTSNLDYDSWRGGSDSSDPEKLALSLSIPVVNQQSWRVYQQAFPYVAAVELDLQATIQEKILLLSVK